MIHEREVSRRIVRYGPSAGLWIETLSRWICACSPTDFYFLPASLSNAASSASAVAHEPFDQASAPETCWRSVLRVALTNDPYQIHEGCCETCIAPDALFHVVGYRVIGNSIWLQERSSLLWCTVGVPGELFCFCIGLAPSAQSPRCCLLYAADSSHWCSVSEPTVRSLYFGELRSDQRDMSTVVARQMMQQDKSSTITILPPVATFTEQPTGSSVASRSFTEQSLTSVGPSGPFFDTKCFDDEVRSLAAGNAGRRHLDAAASQPVSSQASTPDSASVRLGIASARSVSITVVAGPTHDDDETNDADVLALTGGARSSPCLPRSRSRGDFPISSTSSQQQVVFLICTYVSPPQTSGNSASRRNVVVAGDAATGWQASINVHYITFAVSRKGLAVSRVKVVENNVAPLSISSPPPITSSRVVFNLGYTQSSADDVQKAMRTTLSKFTRGGGFAEGAINGNCFACELAKFLLPDQAFQLPAWLV